MDSSPAKPIQTGNSIYGMAMRAFAVVCPCGRRKSMYRFDNTMVIHLVKLKDQYLYMFLYVEYDFCWYYPKSSLISFVCKLNMCQSAHELVLKYENYGLRIQGQTWIGKWMNSRSNLNLNMDTNW